jgi:hypothetical protein
MRACGANVWSALTASAVAVNFDQPGDVLYVEEAVVLCLLRFDEFLEPRIAKDPMHRDTIVEQSGNNLFTHRSRRFV